MEKEINEAVAIEEVVNRPFTEGAKHGVGRDPISNESANLLKTAMEAGIKLATDKPNLKNALELYLKGFQESGTIWRGQRLNILHILRSISPKK